MSKPETPLDVEDLLREHVPSIDLPKYLEFTEDDQNLIINITRYMPEGWDEIMDLVVSWDGAYDQPTRRWLIPKEPEPAKGPHPHTELGYFPSFPIDNILSGKFSFRLNIGEGIDELMGEIHGAGRIIEPLICRPHRNLTYVEVGPGERRLLAARNLGLKTVPVIVDKFSDQEFDCIRLLENIARKDLTDYEMARILDHMLKTYPDDYPTQQALAEDFGKTQGWVANHLRMLGPLSDLNISREILEKMTEHQAREILAAPPDKRKEIAEYIQATGETPSIREIKRFVQPEVVEPEIKEETEVREVPEGSVEVPGEEISTADPIRAEASAGSEPARDINATAGGPSQVITPAEKPERGIPKTKSSPIDTGLKFDCPVCGETYVIIHVDEGKHRFERITVMDSEH